MFDYLTQAIGYQAYAMANPDGQERWDNVMELPHGRVAVPRLPPVEALTSFLESVALVSDVDSLEEGVDRVTLITLHQAKGLEFPVVFMTG